MKLLIVLLAIWVVFGVVQTTRLYNANKREYIEQYTGLGSGVLKHGTLIEGDYEDPSSVVGHIDRAGTWVIRKK